MQIRRVTNQNPARSRHCETRGRPTAAAGLRKGQDLFCYADLALKRWLRSFMCGPKGMVSPWVLFVRPSDGTSVITWHR